jgi:outer membrane protein TolC
MMVKIILVWVLAGVLANAKSDRAETLPTIPLNKILEMVSSRSHSTRSAKLVLQAERERVEQAGVWQNPVLALSMGSISNPDGQGPILEGTVSQVVPFFGKISARHKSAELSREIAEANVFKVALQEECEAFVRAYQLAALRRLTAHTEERRKRFRMVREFLAVRSTLVPTQKVEKQLVENKLVLLEEHLTLKKSQLQQSWAALRELTQEPSEFIPDVPWWEKPDTASLSASTDNPASPLLSQQKLSVQKSEAELVVGERNLLPDLNLGLGYRNERTGSATHFYTGYLTLVLPLVDRGQHSLPALKSQLEAEQARLTAKKNEVQRQTEVATIAVKRACDVVRLYPLASLTKLQKDFSEAETEFRRGRLPIGLYLEVEAQSHELQDRVFESQVELARSLAELSLLQGKLVTMRDGIHDR